VGVERGVKFRGMSQILDPNMEILAKSGRRNEDIRVVEIDPGKADQKNITPRNNLWSDRRIDLYKPLIRRFPR
ncbi:acyltransferase, partial [Candidatus Bathyarchaeota archaeon]|nr:acyltransferase [Candidatus Bathyarchaeota archaeon]